MKKIFIAVFLKYVNVFIYGEFYTKHKIIFFAQLHVSTCPRNVGIELSIRQGNEHVFSCSMLNLMLLMLKQYECPNTSTPKNDFSLTPFFSNSI